MPTENTHLIWIDCEMTGLSLANDALVEIAVLVTDSQLNPIGVGADIVIKTSQEKLDQMSPFVKNMHTESGLLPLISQGASMEEAETKVLDYLISTGIKPGTAPLAGNSISMDKNFIARDMPKLDAFLHYRIVDVSSLKELVKRWYPEIAEKAPTKTGNHRAMGDVRDSIEELRYYRENIFSKQN